MRPLVIDNIAKAEIARVVAYAEAHKYPKSYMEMRMQGRASAPGDMDSFTCHIQVGYKCVYSVEEHPCGWCHHLSVSVDDPKKVPSIPAFQMLMKEFGIEKDFKHEDVHVWIEEDISPKAVNIIAKK